MKPIGEYMTNHHETDEKGRPMTYWGGLDNQHDKEMREAFEEWFGDKQWNKYECEAAWQASRQHIIDKLQSEETVERVGKAIANGDRDLNECSEQVIAAVLEGI